MAKFKRIWTRIFVVLVVLVSSNCFLLKQRYHENLLINGKIGSGPGEIRWETIDYLPTGPTSFGINNRGEIFILDYLNHRVVKFNSKGNYSDEILQGAHQNLMDIAFSNNGDVFIEYISGDVSIYDRGLSFVKTLELKSPVPPISPEMTHLEVTDRGTILIVDPNLDQTDQIIEVDTNENILQTKDNLDGYIETKGEYYVKATSSGEKILYKADNDKAIFSLSQFNFL